MLALMPLPTGHFWQVRIISEEVRARPDFKLPEACGHRHRWKEAQISDHIALQISLSIIHVS